MVTIFVNVVVNADLNVLHSNLMLSHPFAQLVDGLVGILQVVLVVEIDIGEEVLRDVWESTGRHDTQVLNGRTSYWKYNEPSGCTRGFHLPASPLGNIDLSTGQIVER